ncbi:MAG: hypothetical protein ABR954_06640 [Dehalococcoidales bacterium]
MKWIKRGLIFQPTKAKWMITHATLPFAEKIGEDIYRVYFSARDQLNRSQPGFIEIDIKEPYKCLYISETPILGLGDLGCFDDSGVTACCIVEHRSTKFLFYNGWNRGVTVPYHIYLGLAISKDEGKTFEKISKVPILDRNIHDPCITSSPSILIENGIWRMWYSSGGRWEVKNGKFKNYYQIKYAESRDGVDWERKGVVCIPYKSKDEYAIGRPCVLKEGSKYKMWYSYSSGSYRIGYAESKDGVVWERKDEEVGIDVSESGWDSESIEYPFVFIHQGKKYLLYNGNQFGKDGFGLAIETSI